MSAWLVHQIFISDKQNAFNLNGLEIDLDELEAFEKRIQAKREAKQLQQHNCTTTIDSSFSSTIDSNVNTTNAEAEVDELDEYLKTLKLKEEEQSKTLCTSNIDKTSSTCLSTIDSDSRSSMSFALFLYWFLAILNLASATLCKHYSK